MFYQSGILALLHSEELAPALVRASAGSPVILFRAGAPVQTEASVKQEHLSKQKHLVTLIFGDVC